MQRSNKTLLKRFIKNSYKTKKLLHCNSFFVLFKKDRNIKDSIFLRWDRGGNVVTLPADGDAFYPSAAVIGNVIGAAAEVLCNGAYSYTSCAGCFGR